VFNKNTLWQLQGICRQAGNIRTASSWFPDRDKILSALDSAGFKVIAVETFCYEKYYKDFWELLNVLKRMGSNSSQNPDVPGLGWRKTLNRADCLYKARFGSQKGLPATFEAFLIKCNTGEYS
jgi:predicted oxidoreductase